MKYLLLLALILSGQSFAVCVIPQAQAPVVKDGVTVGNVSSTVYVRIGVQALENCVGTGYLWIPTAEETRQALANPPVPDEVAPVVTAIQDSTLSITTALACLCFFVGLNSWESSAK